MEENEFIPVNQEKKNTDKKKSKNKSSKKGKGKKGNSFLNKIDFNKIATVVGSFLILFSFFLTVPSTGTAASHDGKQARGELAMFCHSPCASLANVSE